jgi:hypothetical protein
MTAQSFSYDVSDEASKKFGHLMLLFSAIERSDASAQRNSEPMFDFYDRAARPMFAEYRSIVEGWLAEMGTTDAVELAAQMRSPDDEKYESGLIELVMHASFIRLGYKVEVHPALAGNQNRPDFLLKNADGAPLAYIEVTTINPPRADVSDERREAPIRDRLNQVELPEDMRLSYDVEEAGSTSPSLGRLVAQVEIWARREAETARAGNEVQKVFTAGEWKIRLCLLRGFRARRGGRKVAWFMNRVISIGLDDPAKALMSALKRKATRYGTLPLPYVIVVADRTECLAAFAGDLAGNVAGGLTSPHRVVRAKC